MFNQSLLNLFCQQPVIHSHIIYRCCMCGICWTKNIRVCCNLTVKSYPNGIHHDDVIKWKHFPRYWPFVRGIHRSPVNSPHKGQRRGALMFSLICAWTNGLVNHRDASDLKPYPAHYEVTVMILCYSFHIPVHGITSLCTVRTLLLF